MTIAEPMLTLLEQATSLPDDQLNSLITCLEKERHARIETTQEAARKEIERIAEEAGIVVSVRRKPADSTIHLRQGDIYRNPANHSQEYVVGNGRPPNWFILLRAEKRLPLPTGRKSLKRMFRPLGRGGDSGARLESIGSPSTRARSS